MLIEVGEFLGGMLITNAGEWLIHKYVLHGLGKKKKSFFSFHWSEHHRACRKHDFFDPDYQRSAFGRHAQGREAGLLVLLGISVVPLGIASPWALGGIWTGLVLYYVVHKRAHLNPAWAKRWVKHHWEHHMMGDQQHSWNVTIPIFDFLLRTRWRDANDA